MNKDKVGEPFHYPNTFLLLEDMPKYIFTCLIDKPKKELHKRTSREKVPSILDHTTISRRINKLNLKLKYDGSKESNDDYAIIAIDSTGIKVTNRGQWLRDKWNIRKDI